MILSKDITPANAREVLTQNPIVRDNVDPTLVSLSVWLICEILATLPAGSERNAAIEAVRGMLWHSAMAKLYPENSTR